MKTMKIISALLLVIAGVSCSGKDDPGLPDGGGTHEVTLAFNIELSADTETRADRELTSTDCLQSVEDVRIYVFRAENEDAEDDEFLLFDPSYDVGTMNKDRDRNMIPHIYVKAFESNISDKNVIDKYETHSLTLSLRLKEGYYRFLALGRDDDPSKSKCELDWIVGATSWEEALMANGSGQAAVREFFTGYAANEGEEGPAVIHVSKDGETFRTSILMRRAVAGIFLYVRNIPDVKSDFAWPEAGIEKGSDGNKVTEVALVATGYEGRLYLPGRRGGEDFLSAASRLNLTRLASVRPETEGTPFAAGRNYKSGKFLFPAVMQGRLLSPSILSGDTGAGASLAICFYHGDYPLLLKPVRIARTQDLHPGTGDRESDASLKGRYDFDFLANNLYCFGYYSEEEGIDNPIDLSEALEHDLEIVVIGAWQAIVDIEM